MSTSDKERLDVLLMEAGYASSREEAKRCIMAGEVFVNGQREDKPGSSFSRKDLQLEYRGKRLPYVSRGGLKLEKALKVFPINLEGAHCIDIGASTGGFTDCMLQNGASFVYAVDSGTNQLAWKLRSDERVCSMEKTNFRYLTPEDIPEMLDFAAADVSFISLDKILPAARPLLKEAALMVCLIKPQFEAGRELVGKHGVVKDKKVHADVIERVLGFARDSSFVIRGLDSSPIRGPEGNIEYLLFLSCGGEDEVCPDIMACVERAHAELAG
ncbi:MAG: TlyA family RNA methyltransferase [Lachnospiraceae bacterium]|nr:TlyA family RNA methyltransferase [Lachnospiraceae bacterium]